MPGVFGEAEIDRLKTEVLRLRENPSTFIRHEGTDAIYFHGSLSNYKELGDVVFDSRVLGIAESLLEDQVVYFGDSSFQMGRGPRRFHRDNIDRLNWFDPDWEDRYPIIRLAIYLGNYSKQSGGLKVVPKSHRPLLSKLHHPIRRLLGRYTKYFAFPLWKIADKLSYLWPGYNIPSRTGDVA